MVGEEKKSRRFLVLGHRNEEGKVFSLTSEKEGEGVSFSV